MKEMVEHRHPRKKKAGREREKERSELGGGYLGEGRAPPVDLAVQTRNVELLLEIPLGS